MKAKRLFFLVMAICLASGVKAQFYDSADDIYYYVEYKDGRILDDGGVFVFNFDGQKACFWDESVSSLKNNLKRNPSYYEDKVETTDYCLKYINDCRELVEDTNAMIDIITPKIIIIILSLMIE